MTAVLNNILALFLIIGAGFYARRRGWLGQAVNKGLADLLMNVALPLMILVSFGFDYSPEALRSAGRTLVAALAVHAGLVALAWLNYGRLAPAERAVLRFATIFGNCAFMGFPVLHSLLGPSGVFLGAMYLAPFNLFFWTVGPILFSRKRDPRALAWALLNPGLISVGLGLVMFVFSLRLPGPVHQACQLLGSVTTPLAMLLIGSMLAEMRLGEVFAGPAVWFFCLLRLLVAPVLTFLAGRAWGLGAAELTALVVLTGMPTAANTAVFAQAYGADAALASRCVFLSTLLSALTMPLIVSLPRLWP